MSTSTTSGVQTKMPLATETTAVPPVKRDKGCEGPVWVPLRVCGFQYSFDDYVLYAKRNLQIDYDLILKENPHVPIKDYCRQDAVKHIKKLLDCPDTVIVRLADGGLRSCILVGSNYDDEELAMACDPERVAKFQMVLGVTGEPKWYRLRRS
ncbi:hypothetical protein HGRIS_000300 [Hohenbuehelia grisea]|uniref:Uncharacterized protein n=1 Tax=Hohenbuehelia grisea TaxID=104357 RepID=A0ABR3JRK1_9AGAR